MLGGEKAKVNALFVNQKAGSDMYSGCIFSRRLNYSLDYYFLINGEHIRYLIEFSMRNFCVSEKLYINDGLMMERMGTNAKSYFL